MQVVIVDNGSGDADYIINYGSLQDSKNNAGYAVCLSGTAPFCTAYSIARYLASGFGTRTETGTLYASLQDQTGYLYNGSPSASALDGGANALNEASLNSDVPGRFIFRMVSGYVPEVATIPSAPVNFAESNVNDSVTATWEPPVRQGGAPLTGYVLRYRLSGTTDAYTEITTRNLTATISGLAAGNYAMQVAAVNEIGRGPFSRSLLVAVSGPVYADMSAYTEALTFAQTLNSAFFTPASWADLVSAISVTVTRTNTQVDVDAQTLLINTAIANLVLIPTPVFAVSYIDYNIAVAFANSLTESDFTASTWSALQTELAVDVSTADQQTVDNQTAAINTAINNLLVDANVLVTSDLTLYNAAVRTAFALEASDYSTSSWAALQAALSTPITRQTLQADVDAQTLLITNAIAALELVSDLSAFNLALADASQYSSATVTPATWNALQLAIGVTVGPLTPQAEVDAATDAINAAIDALVFTANMTAYNAAVAQAGALNEEDYTAESWALLQAALAIQVSPLTDSQIFVDIATTNITSAIRALNAPRQVTYVLAGAGGAIPTETVKFTGDSFTLASTPVRPGYVFGGWTDGVAVYAAGALYLVGAADVTLTATWVSNPVRTITFSSGGGTGNTPALAPSSLPEGQSFELPNNSYSFAGFTFAGWSDGSVVHPEGHLFLVGANDVSLVATWSEVPLNMAAYNAAVAQAGALNSAIYSSATWSVLQAALAVQVSPLTDSQLFVDNTTSAILAAIAGLVETRSVTYALAGGQGSAPTQADTAIAGSFTVATAPSRAGYTFAGWSDGTVVYQAGSTYIVGSTNVAFVASWVPIAHSITYALNGGSGSAPTQVATATAGSLTVAAAASRAGYTFAGWSDGTVVYQAGSTYTVGTANVTFTATWTPNASRAISFSAGGGTGSDPSSAPSSVLSGQSFALPLNTFTRTGYTFAGWSDGVSVHAAGHNMTVVSDLNLVATWTKNVVSGNSKLTVSGFKFEKSALSNSMKAQMRRWAQSNPNVTNVTCTGYTGWNYSKLSPTALAQLGKARASAVCNYLKKLNSNLVIKLGKSVHSKSKSPSIRKVVLSGR